MTDDELRKVYSETWATVRARIKDYVDALTSDLEAEKGELSEWDEDDLDNRRYEMTTQAKIALKRAAERRDPPDVALSRTLISIGLW